MSATPGSAPPDQAQLQQFIDDLKTARSREREQAQQTASAYAQLTAYAQDVKVAWKRERQRAEQLERAYLNTLQVLLRASAYKDEETGAHIKRISHYSKGLCLTAGFGEAEAQLVFEASPMHDVGKIGVPDYVLKKPGGLDPDE